MKNSTFYALMVILACIIMGLVVSCSETKTIADATPAQQEAFESCISDHPSDAVCDSCWSAIIGKGR